MSSEINRKGKGRRLPTDASGCTSVPHWDKCTPKQRFYAAYQYFRMEPGEPCQLPEDVAAKLALKSRGEAASDQSFDGETDAQLRGLKWASLSMNTDEPYHRYAFATVSPADALTPLTVAIDGMFVQQHGGGHYLFYTNDGRGVSEMVYRCALGAVETGLAVEVRDRLGRLVTIPGCVGAR